MNAFILETAASQGWLSDEQIHAARQALTQDDSLSVLDFISHQGWLTKDHIAWLEQAAAAPPQSTSESVLIPTDIHFEVKLAEDQALGHLNDYLQIGQYYGASDVHIGVAAPPMMRNKIQNG